MTQTPNLSALRAFEAAARHQNFSLAADELGLTHGAISHQVRALEARLGRDLFRREGRGVRLTLEGARLRQKVEQGLSALDSIFSEEASAPSKRVALSVLGSFANHWLAPRLGELQARFPDIVFDFHIDERLINPGSELIDAAIRYGPGGWSGVRSDFLFEDYAVPVCAPEIALRYDIRSLADIATCPLIDDHSQSWSAWFAATGVRFEKLHARFSYSDSGAALEAARAGAGMLLARLSLAAPDFFGGALIAPVAKPVKTDYSYYFIRRSGKDGDGTLDGLRAWLTSEGRRTIDEGLASLDHSDKG